MNAWPLSSYQLHCTHPIKLGMNDEMLLARASVVRGLKCTSHKLSMRVRYQLTWNTFRQWGTSDYFWLRSLTGTLWTIDFCSFDPPGCQWWFLSGKRGNSEVCRESERGNKIFGGWGVIKGNARLVSPLPEVNQEGEIDVFYMSLVLIDLARKCIFFFLDLSYWRLSICHIFWCKTLPLY